MDREYFSCMLCGKAGMPPVEARAHECKPAPTPWTMCDRCGSVPAPHECPKHPTTEEGEKRRSLGSIINYQEFKGIKYVLLDTHLAAVSARDAAVTRMHEQDTWAAKCMEERDAAQEEVAGARKVLEDRVLLKRENARLRELLRTAEGALEFYATGFAKKLTDSMMGVNTPALGDGGRIAREALSRLRSGKEGKP